VRLSSSPIGLRNGRFPILNQVPAAIEYALSNETYLAIPSGSEERQEMLRDLIRMMAADGDLADVEKDLFATAAAKMEISEDELNQIIDSVLLDCTF
jgi:hypothetical protein